MSPSAAQPSPRQLSPEAATFCMGPKHVDASSVSIPQTSGHTQTGSDSPAGPISMSEIGIPALSVESSDPARTSTPVGPPASRFHQSNGLADAQSRDAAEMATSRGDGSQQDTVPGPQAGPSRLCPPIEDEALEQLRAEVLAAMQPLQERLVSGTKPASSAAPSRQADDNEELDVILDDLDDGFGDAHTVSITPAKAARRVATADPGADPEEASNADEHETGAESDASGRAASNAEGDCEGLQHASTEASAAVEEAAARQAGHGHPTGQGLPHPSPQNDGNAAEQPGITEPNHAPSAEHTAADEQEPMPLSHTAEEMTEATDAADNQPNAEPKLVVQTADASVGATEDGHEAMLQTAEKDSKADAADKEDAPASDDGPSPAVVLSTPEISVVLAGSEPTSVSRWTAEAEAEAVVCQAEQVRHTHGAEPAPADANPKPEVQGATAAPDQPAATEHAGHAALKESDSRSDTEEQPHDAALLEAHQTSEAVEGDAAAAMPNGVDLQDDSAPTELLSKWDVPPSDVSGGPSKLGMEAQVRQEMLLSANDGYPAPAATAAADEPSGLGTHTPAPEGLDPVSATGSQNEWNAPSQAGPEKTWSGQSRANAEASETTLMEGGAASKAQGYGPVGTQDPALEGPAVNLLANATSFMAGSRPSRSHDWGRVRTTSTPTGGVVKVLLRTFVPPEANGNKPVSNILETLDAGEKFNFLQMLFECAAEVAEQIHEPGSICTTMSFTVQRCIWAI